MKVQLDHGSYMPERAHSTDAGLDLRSPVAAIVPARGSVTIDTGVHIALPHGTAGMLVSKSGLNHNHDITSDGLVDIGYTGSIRVKLYNHGDTDYHIARGDKISQLVVIKYMPLSLQRVAALPDTARGTGGFGSSGR